MYLLGIRILSLQYKDNSNCIVNILKDIYISDNCNRVYAQICNTNFFSKNCYWSNGICSAVDKLNFITLVLTTSFEKYVCSMLLDKQWIRANSRLKFTSKLAFYKLVYNKKNAPFKKYYNIYCTNIYKLQE